jgi:hypothetical protein
VGKKGRKRKVTEYYHRGVVAHLIGFAIDLPLDVEMIRPGEEEVGAAKRLLKRVFRTYARFFDAVVGDAIYLEGPFFRFCRSHGKHVIAVLKDNNPALLADAKGLFRDEPPRTTDDGQRTIAYWDAEGFTSSSGIEEPLRIVHTCETEAKRQRIARQWKHTNETHDWWWASSIPQAILSTRQFWQAGHGRWDIENKIFNALVNYWSLDHCFHHQPLAIQNFVLTLFIVFVLIQAFYGRNLKAPVRERFTLTAIAWEIRMGLAALGTWRAPWLDEPFCPPP